jgi:hypothetical protein
MPGQIRGIAIPILLIGLSVVLAACGQSQAGLDTEATQIATRLVVTQTAGAPPPTVRTGAGTQGTALVVNPGAQTKTVCDSQITVGVSVQNVTGMSAVQIDVVFNPTVLQVIDADSGQAGVQIRVDPVFDSGFVAANDVDNDSGRITFAVTLFGGNTIDENSGIIEIDFEPVSAGSSELRLENAILASALAQPLDHQTGIGSIEVLADCENGGAGAVGPSSYDNKSTRYVRGDK